MDEIYINDGNGLFTAQGSGVFTGSEYGGADYGDLDGDDDLDFVYSGTTTMGAQTFVCINDGDGNFTIDQSAGLQGVEDSHIQIVDMNFDNKPDVLLHGGYRIGSNPREDVNILYLNSTITDVFEYVEEPEVAPYMIGENSLILADDQVEGILITSVNGQEMVSSDEAPKEILTDSWASGIYVLNAWREEQRISQRLLIK